MSAIVGQTPRLNIFEGTLEYPRPPVGKKNKKNSKFFSFQKYNFFFFKNQKIFFQKSKFFSQKFEKIFQVFVKFHGQRRALQLVLNILVKLVYF